MAIVHTVTGVEAPLVEDEGYIAAMVAKAEGTILPSESTPTEQQKEDKVERLLAGKYKSVEDLENGYQELQKAFSKKAVAPIADTPAENPLAIPENQETAEEVLESAGLDFNTFDEEWRTSGELSKESYEKLQKAGIPQQMVDAYIQGQQLLAQQATTRIFDTAGGQEEYTKLVQWAATNLPKEDVAAYNAAIASEDINQMILATRGLKATFESTRGKTPSLLQGDTSGDVSRELRYNSKSEMTADMRDPRYQKDAQFRQMVQDKLSRSSFM